MSESGTVYVEDPDTALETYAVIRVYRGSTADPTTATFLTQVGSDIPLVSGQFAYPFTDSSASGATIWRATFFNSVGPVESGLGPLISVTGALTLRNLRYLGASRAGAASAGACSGAGTTSPGTLVDAVLLNSGVDSSFLEGAWVYRPDALTASDKVRRVKKAGFNTSTGALSFYQDYALAPAVNEVYQIFQFFPPTAVPDVARSWDAIVRDALNARWFIDRVTLGLGNGHTRRFSLAAFPDITESTFRRAFFRRTASNGDVTEQNMSTNGRFTNFVSNAGALSLEFWPPPMTDQEIWVEAIRQDNLMYVDTDTTLLAQTRAECAVVVAAYKALRALQPGKYEGEYRAALDALAAEEDIHRPADMIVGL